MEFGLPDSTRKLFPEGSLLRTKSAVHVLDRDGPYGAIHIPANEIALLMSVTLYSAYPGDTTLLCLLWRGRIIRHHIEELDDLKPFAIVSQ